MTEEETTRRGHRASYNKRGKGNKQVEDIPKRTRKRGNAQGNVKY